jgi:hypothetical protein
MCVALLIVSLIMCSVDCLIRQSSTAGMNEWLVNFLHFLYNDSIKYFSCEFAIMCSYCLTGCPETCAIYLVLPI